MPTQKPVRGVPDEADRFEATLKAARVDSRLHEPLWDIWVLNPSRATVLVRRLAPPPAVTVKAKAPGMTSVELPIALAQALAQARAQRPDADLIALLGAGEQKAGVTTITDQQTIPTRKNARPNIFDAISDQLVREHNSRG